MNIFKISVSFYAIGIAGCNHQRNDPIGGHNNSQLLIQIQAAREKLKLKDAPDTHGHESMELGEKAMHKHACSMCNKEYRHKHTKKVSGSCNYRHLCNTFVSSMKLPTCTEM